MTQNPDRAEPCPSCGALTVPEEDEYQLFYKCLSEACGAFGGFLWGYVKYPPDEVSP